MITSIDPGSGENVSLFNPRTQDWSDHFEWVDDGVQVLGKTPTGRATIERMKMNIERVVTSRQIWVKAGAHPPS